jgi:restriction endonuclease Mrr
VATISQFPIDAKDYVTRVEKRIVLIDGEQLAQVIRLMHSVSMGTDSIL